MSLLLLLKQTAAAAYTLSCSGGSVSLVGNEATLIVGRKVVAATGAIRLETNIATAVFSDDFNRADAANLGANWTITQGGFTVTSNKVYGNVTDYRSIALPTANYSSNQGAKITVSGDFSDTFDHVGIGVRLSSGVAQDYRNWTELDPTSVLSRNPTLVTISGMNAISGTGVHGQWYDGGTNWKTGNFWSSVGAVNVTTGGNNSRFIIAAVTTNNTSGADSGNENRPSIQVVWVGTTTTPRIELVQYRSADNLTSTPIAIDSYQGSAVAVNTPFYIEFERVGSVANCRIYSDASHLTLVDTLTINLTEVVSFRYFYVAGKSSTGSSATVSATIGPVNFDTPQTGYVFRGDGFSDSSRTLRRLSYGNIVAIGAPALPIVAGDIVEVTAVDSLISVYINNILKYSVIDTAYTSEKPGITYEWGNTRDVFIDDFYSWNISGSADLKASRTLSCATATYNEDLKPANLLIGRKVVADCYTDVTLFTDNFNVGTVNTPLTGYTQQGDNNIVYTGTGTIKQDGNNRSVAYRSDINYSANQWAEITIAKLDTSFNCGVALRVQTSSSKPTEKTYHFTTNDAISAPGFSLSVYDNSSALTDLAFFSAQPAVGDRLRFEAVGNVLSGYVNGKLVIRLTNNIWSSGKAGIKGAGVVWESDDFASGNYGGLHFDALPATTKVSRRLVCATATYNEDLKPANLLVTRRLVADTQTYNEDLKPANLLVGRKLVAKVYADEQLFSDDFTGAAGVLGSNYTQQGDVPLRIDGLGNANAAGASRGLAWPNTVSFSNDQYAEITVIQIDTGTSNNSGVGLRIQTNVSPTVEQGYIFKTGDKGAAYALSQYNTSSTNVVISTSIVIPKVGDRIRAVAIGNTQYFYVNDQLVLSASDSSWSSGVPAIYGNGTVWKSDNFVAGNYGGLHLAGTYTNTRAARRLVCDSASYTLSFKDATLTKTTTARTITADVQSYTLAGEQANLLVSRKLTSDTRTYTFAPQPANLLVGKKLTSDTRTYTFAPQPANLLVGKKLTSDTRTYTFAPQPANLLVGKKLTSDTRTYTFAPQSANLKASRALSAAVQSYTLSLKDASIKAGKKLTSDVGSYTLSLKDATLKVGRKVTTDKQTYTFNGNNANLKASRTLLSATQNYTLSLKDAALKSGRKLTSDTRTYTFAPQPANLLFGRKLTSDIRAYTLSLKDANLKASRILTNDKQTYTLTGIPVGISKVGSYSLAAVTSAFTLNINPVNLRVTRRLISDTGSYTFNGNPTSFLYGRKVTADKQTYTLSLKDAAVKVGKRLVADKQTYTLSLKDAAFSRSRKIIGDSSSYSLSLKDANVKIGRKLTGDIQTYTLSLKDAALRSGRKLTGDTRPYSLSLKDSNLLYGRKITGEQASYVFTYNGMLFARGGFVKVWTGSAWVQKPLKVWNGTAWVSKPLKIWTGSTWRTY